MHTESHTLRLLPLFLPAAFALSCGTEPLPGPPSGAPVTLSLSLGVPATRAVSPGVAALNEDAVRSVDVILYVGTGGSPVHVMDRLEVSADGTTATGTVPASAAASLRAAASPTALVVANRPDGCTLASGPLDEVLAGTVLTSPLASPDVKESLPMSGTCTLSFTGNAASGAVSLVRAVAKVGLRITEVSSPDGVWQPDRSGVRAVLKNCAGSGTLSGSSATDPDDLFDGIRYPLADDGTALVPSVPFYTYPSDWSADADRTMRLIFSIPWSDDGGATWRQCHYQVPVGGAAMKVAAGEYHEIRLSVSILGSFEEEEPTGIEPSVTVQAWGAEEQDADIRDIIYLVVEANSVTIHNRDETSVRYWSSHKAVVSSASLTREDLKEGGTVTIDPGEYTCELDGGRLVFRHTINNSGEAGADFVPYVLTATVSHEGNAAYSQTVTVIQHPAISVTASPNSGATVTGSKGYAYVNNGSGSSYGGNPSASGSTTNYNMYVVTTTRLAANSSYTIGDPRSQTVDNLPTTDGRGNLSYTWSSRTYDLDGTSRRLSWYHPAESGERTVHMLAPSFRVASSYGACTKISYDNARRRCASYQEDGYPAGRWRIPTAAEVMYIISLSEQGTIPTLFTTTYGGNGYWCANGSIIADTSNKAVFTDGDFSSTHSVRCVYDEWYWGDFQITPRTSFRWGDQETF